MTGRTLSPSAFGAVVLVGDHRGDLLDGGEGVSPVREDAQVAAVIARGERQVLRSVEASTPPRTTARFTCPALVG